MRAAQMVRQVCGRDESRKIDQVVAALVRAFELLNNLRLTASQQPQLQVGEFRGQPRSRLG